MDIAVEDGFCFVWEEPNKQVNLTGLTLYKKDYLVRSDMFELNLSLADFKYLIAERVMHNTLHDIARLLFFV